MSELKTIQRGINRVRNFRSLVRNGSAWSVCIALAIWGLLSALVLDVSMNMGKLERGVTLLLLIALAIWALRKYILPLFGVHEGDVETVIMIEKRHGLSTDLVATMQFADTTRTQFGSEELRMATVGQGSKVASALNYLEGFSKAELNKRLAVFVLSAVVLLVVLFTWPAHGKAFFNRLLLGSAHYPTKTVITEVVYPRSHAPFGLPLVFQVRVDGELPETGTIKVKTIASGLATVVDLAPDETDPNLYRGELGRALEDFTYQVYLGDAYTDTRLVKLTPLPVVDVAFNIEVPAYAREKFAATILQPQGDVALEGSRVIPVVTADKPLESATLTIEDEKVELMREGDAFTLKGSAHPLQHMTETVHWEVQVVDKDELSLEQPRAGVIQVRPDQPPNVGIASASRLIWSGAAPKIQYKAIDDYALTDISAYLSLQRWQDGETEASPERKLAVATVEAHASEAEGSYTLNLQNMKLLKGDRLFVTFEVTDYRGDLSGRSMRSEPIVLEVSDREGVLEALRELDSELERKLDQIINAQLGIGDSQ
jgi:hypothetical protein